jgi:hypothetical protein
MDSPLADPAEWTLLAMQCCELIAATVLGKTAASWALLVSLVLDGSLLFEQPKAQGYEAGV